MTINRVKKKFCSITNNRIEMNDILFKKIKRANSKYAEYLSACDKVAKAAIGNDMIDEYTYRTNCI